jgi:disintegrin and metalloproteinase domain-containing protein 10
MRANDTNDKSATNNPYAQEYIGVEKFLDIISLEPTSSDADKRYCLSHVFTYRDFEDGVLGLAWVAERGKLSGKGTVFVKPVVDIC